MRITPKLVALARSAGALSGVPVDATAERNGEQANAYAALIAACSGDAALLAAVYERASKPDAVKRAKPASKPEAAKPEAPKAKPQAEAKPEPEAPSKPHASDKRADYDARVALVGELRATASKLYNGPSLAVRSNPKRVAASIYADLLAAPKHRTTLAKLSERDESFLFTVLQRGDKAGAFDPVSLNLDSGIFSRLASVGFIAASGDAYALTEDALTHARKAAKRAA